MVVSQLVPVRPYEGGQGGAITAPAVDFKLRTRGVGVGEAFLAQSHSHSVM